MEYRRLGKSGLKVSALSLGSWLTFGNQIEDKVAEELMDMAYDSGVNFFDNAEGYAHGEAEILMGNAVREFRREDLVLSTKIFWGGNGPNETGLSRKHRRRLSACRRRHYRGAGFLSRGDAQFHL